MRDLGPRWGEGKLHLAFDLHCPGLSGGGNETLFFVGPQDPRHWENLQRFSLSRNVSPVRPGLRGGSIGVFGLPAG